MCRKRSFYRLLPALACSLFLLLPITAQGASWQWVETDRGLQYMDMDSTASDKSVIRSEFKTIKGQTYYFDARGYVHTGWLTHKKSVYFFRADGTMVKQAWVGNYYFTKSGKMAVSRWIKDQTGRRYVGKDGRWIPNYRKNAKARFVTNQKGTRYRYASGGFAKKTWEYIRGNWYYFYSNGYMAKNRKIGPYYVNKKGQMVINGWVRNGKVRIHYGVDGKRDKKIRLK